MNLAQLFYKLFKSSFSNRGRSISQNGWDSMKGDRKLKSMRITLLKKFAIIYY